MAIEIKLSKKKLQTMTEQLDRELTDLETQYEEEIEGPLITRRKLYEADQDRYKQKYPKLSPISDLTSSDVQDTIEWALPSLMRIMFQSDDVISLRGTKEENDGNAKVHQDLINFQLQRNANGFLIFYDWFKAALMDNMGILKCWWEREEESETYEVTTDFSQLNSWKMDPKIRVLEEREVSNGIYVVKYELLKNILKNQPEFAVVSPAEFRYDMKAKNIRESKLVAQRMIVTADWLRRREREGTLENVEKAIKSYGSEQKKRTNLEVYLSNKTFVNENQETEEPKKEYVYYECWWETDINDDGILEKVIVGKVGSTIVRLEENPMDAHPFFCISPIREPYRVWAKRGLCDLVGEIQDLKTALLRQMIYNVALANDQQAFVNVDVMLDENEFIEGRKAVRVSGSPKDAVYYMPHQTIEGIVFSFIELADTIKENRTGITKYNQGMSADTLNKTATGISRIMDASTQRLEMILRMFLETGVKDLFRFLIALNQKYIDQTTSLRISGQTLIVTPDNLRGEIDIVVNAALAMGSKEERLSKLTTLLGLYQTAIPAGIASVKHATHVFGKMVEEMGYKDIGNFCYKPEEAEQMLSQIQQNQAQAAQQQQQSEMQMKQMEIQLQGQMQMELEKMRQEYQMQLEMLKHKMEVEKTMLEDELHPYEQYQQEDMNPRVSINAKDLPPEGVVQAAKLAGIEISEQEVTKQRDADRNAKNVNKPANGNLPKGAKGGGGKPVHK